MLGPVGNPAAIETAESEHEHFNPVESARECAYNHVHYLIEALGAAGHQVGVQLDEVTFVDLERVE
jgi:hypothetical protein